jgi:hypothetical protein
VLLFFGILFVLLFSVVMASSKVARRRQGSLPKEPPAAVDASDSDGEKDSGLDEFEIIKTIGELRLLALRRADYIRCQNVLTFNVLRLVLELLASSCSICCKHCCYVAGFYISYVIC